MEDRQPSSAPSPPQPAIILRGLVPDDNNPERRVCYLIPRPRTYEAACVQALQLFPSRREALTDDLDAPLPPYAGGLGLAVALSGIDEVYLTPEAWNTAPLVDVPLDKPLVIEVDCSRLSRLRRPIEEDSVSRSSGASPGETEVSVDEGQEPEREEQDEHEESDSSALGADGAASSVASTSLAAPDNGEDDGTTLVNEAGDQPEMAEPVEEGETESDSENVDSLAPPPTPPPPTEDPVPPPRPEDRMLRFEVKSFVTSPRVTVELHLSPSGQVCDLLAELEDRLNLDVSTSFDKYRLKAGPRTLKWGDPLSSIPEPAPDIPRSLHLHKHGRQAEPQCHLLAPFDLPTVWVGVHAAQGGYFDRTYPRRPITTYENGSRSVSWRVAVKAGGRLTEEGRSIGGIFWEVVDQEQEFPDRFPNLPIPLRLREDSPPLQRLLTLEPTNSCLIPAHDFLPHFTSLLELFPLTSSMRSAFLEYMRPATTAWELFHHPGDLFVAFRFASQENLAAAIDLRVDPEPDVLARVFLLYGTVERRSPERRWNWRKPERVDWVLESGIDVARAQDEELFRVIEWGAMKAVL